ncbi:MAG: hypothetical protein ACRERV_01450 [Methylococcales bacterium]
MSIHSSHKYQLQVIAIILTWLAVEVHAAPLSPENARLIRSTNIKPNVILSIDDSGSMDYEILLDTVDGSLWLQQNFIVLNTNLILCSSLL